MMVLMVTLTSTEMHLHWMIRLLIVYMKVQLRYVLMESMQLYVILAGTKLMLKLSVETSLATIMVII